MKRPNAHIGLNAHLLSRQASYRSAGIHRYILQLIRHLPAADARLRFTVFADHQRDESAAEKLAWQTSRWPTGNPWARIAWEQIAQPWAVHRAGVDLLHALAFVSPIVTPSPTVVTVHDLSFLRFPDRFRLLNRLYLSVMTRFSCRRARRIIAVSEATAREVTDLLGVPSERIDVVPHGVDHQHFRPMEADQVATFCQEKGLDAPFVLFIGTLEPRKNLTTLVEAFARSAAMRQGGRLVIAGGHGWHFHEIFQRVEALGLRQAVHFPGFVPHADLPLWYNAANVFVYPSIYEGFGMPLLEAMACGTPVVSSDASCMPAVVGDAGLFVSPQDVDGLSAAIDRLWTDDDLRADLSRRGRERAAAFTWEAAARETVASYRRALQE